MPSQAQDRAAFAVEPVLSAMGRLPLPGRGGAEAPPRPAVR